VPVATGLLTRAGTADLAAAIVGQRLGSLPFDRALADLAGAVLLGCTVWLWLVTSYVVLEAARSRPGRRPGTRAVPAGLRLLVLSACGVAVTGVLAAPVGAVGLHRHPQHLVVPSPVSGLPLPDRAAITTPHRRVTASSRRADSTGPTGPTGPTVVVAPGDTLWSIAARDLPPTTPDAVIARRWHAIYATNRVRIGPDPNLIVPGLRLHLPGKDLP
jgi:nucleoid-associated protein YgaU